MMSRPQFGLALGGGGARGFAHVGVLKRLEELGIQPDIVTGASMGALVAAVYTKTRNADLTHEILDKMVISDEFQKLGLHLINVNRRGGESFWHQVSSAIQDRIVINLAHSKTGLVSTDRIREALEVAIRFIHRRRCLFHGRLNAFCRYGVNCHTRISATR